MEKCEKCLYYKSKEKCGECGRLSNAMDNNPMFMPNTNYDRIKQMSVEEMAEFLNNVSTSLALKMNGEYIVREKDSIKQWLLQEVRDDE